VITRTVTEYKPEYEPAYVANGLVGLRVGKFALVDGAALVNGFVGEHEVERMESYAPAPYPVGADIGIGGRWLSKSRHQATFREQAYDFATGELRTRFDFSAKGATAHVDVVTFCSRTQPTLALQEVRVEVDTPCELALRATIDPSGLPGKCLYRDTPDPGWDLVDGVLHWEARGGLSSCGAASISEFVGGEARMRRGRWGYVDGVSTDYSVSAEPGRAYVLRQIGSLVPSIMHREPGLQAIRMASVARHWGFEELRADNRAAWAELWKGRIRLVGADDCWQAIADASFFYLHSSVHPSSPCSVAPFGLYQSENYSGHVFWDVETHMFPPVLLTAPRAARAMLDYRSRLLDGARMNAALHGYGGVQFPWESMTHGGETMAARYGGIVDEHHISLDVAFAFAQYAHATGDDIFSREQAWPVLRGVADWIGTRARKTGRGYEIRHVEGIDEGIYNIHNNSYTNIAAVVVLREAIAMASRLGYEVPPLWRDIEQRMFVPIDPDTHVILKHGAYEYEGGCCCPETLTALFPIGYRPDPEVERATIDYYLGLAETFIGMPMLPILASVLAARAGDRKLAARMLEAGTADLVSDPYLMIAEYRMGAGTPDEHWGPAGYVTNCGSFLATCLFGLTGLDLNPGEPDSWCERPVAMPECWDAVEVERIWARGMPAGLVARHGDERAKIEPA
jgi:hypothetical protein